GRTRRRPTTASPTRSSCVSTPSASRISRRSSAVERAATASTELERSISTSEASRARAAARTTSGRPRPESTASDMAPTPPRSGSAASLRAGEVTPESLEPVAEIPERGQPDARAGEHERGQDVHAQQRRDQTIAHAPVGLPRRDDHEREPREERDE